ncbi:hypothetical protein SARC_14461 [Sphaeroforma arctica JP610]|uniref:Uncharacterized protein n=1 Tax=Sphaeroforma arctica JP610 TaxID=667725 RepID=A0A0L0F8D1_9EUKA|nr:hypothetical protein SARC_14461 [Sphaeroforma arctica JP610]KNC72975.1 hypothetical protein SARC_14461 [Sphaeroforma arctica JP610]|eukprot:XP_014146877.1 hypothetical protein SARC_14461 [Sphaeroforma arctica JP610]
MCLPAHCIRQPADIQAAFDAATDNHCSEIILFVCDLPCLDAICVATQENYAKLTPLRLKEIIFTKTSGSARNITSPCVDGEGIYAPSKRHGKQFTFCPQGQTRSASARRVAIFRSACPPLVLQSNWRQTPTQQNGLLLHNATQSPASQRVHLAPSEIKPGAAALVSQRTTARYLSVPHLAMLYAMSAKEPT